jgi:hypothetical protein
MHILYNRDMYDMKFMKRDAECSRSLWVKETGGFKDRIWIVNFKALHISLRRRVIHVRHVRHRSHVSSLVLLRV